MKVARRTLKGALPPETEARNRKLTVFAVSLFCVLWAYFVATGGMGTKDSSKPNLKNEDPSGTEIQLCTPATIRSYFEAAERATTLIFFPEVA